MSNSKGTTWLAETRVADRFVVRVGRCGEELIAEFANAGKLTASAGGTRTHFEAIPGARDALLEKLRASVVDAFVRHAQGKVTLHGGAVRIDSKAVGFVGPSRAGKSTLAAALCAEPEIELMGDDSVAIELAEADIAPVQVTTTQSAVWLLPDTRRALGLDGTAPRKTAVALGSKNSDRAVLVAVVNLVFDADAVPPRLRRVRGQDAFAVLFDAAFRFVVDDPKAQMREFDQLRLVVQKCPVYELRRTRDFSQLRHSVSIIRELLAGTHSVDSQC